MAASIEKDMRTYIRTLSGGTSYIGAGGASRLYFLSAPDGSVTLPYIVYFNVAVDGERRYMGVATPQVLFQFSVWHNHKQDGLDLANSLFDGLDGYYGTPGDKKIHYVSAMGPRIIKDPDFDNLYQYVVDATVEYAR